MDYIDTVIRPVYIHFYVKNKAFGGDLASTGLEKPWLRAEVSCILVNPREHLQATKLKRTLWLPK